jgi:glutathione S-transferase
VTDNQSFLLAGRRSYLDLVVDRLENEEEGESFEVPEYFDYLDSELGDREYFVGEMFSIADLTVAAVFVNLRLAGVRPERERWPKLNAFLGRIHSRPSFQQVVTPLVEGIGKRWVELD